MIPQQYSSLSPTQTVNTDLRLINTYLKNQFDVPFHPTTLTHLSSILKNRLGQGRSREDKQKCRDWLALQKVDMQPMLQYVKQKRKEHNENTIAFNSSNKQVVQPTLLHQQQYFQKVIDYALNSRLHFSSSSHSGRERFFTRLMKRLDLGDKGVKGQQFNESNFVRVARNTQKRRKYIALTVDLIKREKLAGENFEIKEWSLTLMQNIDHRIWRIFYQQIQNIEGSDLAAPTQLLTQKILTNSLLALQKQYDENLSKRNEQISSYLESKYLSKLQPGEYILDSQLGCIWGKAFLFFRAGRNKELSNLLRKHRLDAFDDQIRKANGLMRDYCPAKMEVEINYFHEKDIFREQILFALAGERKYSSNAISELNSLDCIWILLRNTGIFYSEEGQLFDEIKEQMVQYYRQNCDPKEMVYFLAYLLDYETLTNIGHNQQLDKDDYLHLLILLSKFPFITANPNLVSHRLTEALTAYAMQLSREEGTPYLQYYISLIPYAILLEEGPSIIVSNKLYTLIKWQVLSQILQRDIFLELLKRTTQQYAYQTNTFLEGAQILMDWIHKQNKPKIQHICSAIDMLVTMLIKNSNLIRVCERREIDQAISLIERWSEGEAELQRSYRCILELFQNERKVKKYLIERDYSQIERFFQRESGNTIFFSSIDYLRGRMFEKLGELGGFDAFFIFMRNIIRAADLVFTHHASSIGLSKDIRYQVLKICKLVQQHQKFGKMVPEDSLRELLRDLQGEISTITV